MVKGIIRVTVVLYALAAVSNILFIQKMKTFHTVTYSLGCLLIVLFCIYYFFELFRLPKSVKLKHNPAFWICTGLLFFYCCGFPLYGLINYWSDISKLILKNFDKIITILNIFLYTLFTIAFLCIRTRKYTLSPS
jgi:tellurite resistance protein TehA-like permease